ncbi:hemerythrin domain-containing protein [Salinimicrobium sediminilitoris]|uniref:hemerythrin domain-containing protein n=1 Tax=Salinimicrobium sediminilitoris TaxID=2876715 RepID=UPI001E655D3B|nr:hemerythrin domain-containing protein [Salinimicrobium sediminilitoris]MCC8360392.1 hemerythrin domain-containing protein [Salinimicrobium sediminilitoris]
MTKPTPLKRHHALKPLSRDHHHGLLLCWKIREGLKKNVPLDRIKKYTDFFFTSQLRPHFKFEEEEIFPLLGDSHPMRVRAIKEHSLLQDLFKAEAVKETFTSIEKELNDHIRFEERELFRELQETVPEEKLNIINNKEEEIITPDPDDWEDKFWQ